MLGVSARRRAHAARCGGDAEGHPLEPRLARGAGGRRRRRRPLLRRSRQLPPGSPARRAACRPAAEVPGADRRRRGGESGGRAGDRRRRAAPVAGGPHRGDAERHADRRLLPFRDPHPGAVGRPHPRPGTGAAGSRRAVPASGPRSGDRRRGLDRRRRRVGDARLHPGDRLPRRPERLRDRAPGGRRCARRPELVPDSPARAGGAPGRRRELAGRDGRGGARRGGGGEPTRSRSSRERAIARSSVCASRR